MEQELIAKTDKQLGICLRFLYGQNIICSASPREVSKNKLEFVILFTVDDKKFQELERQYTLLIS